MGNFSYRWAVLERYPNAYCAVSFGTKAAEDRYQVFCPAHGYLGDMACKNPLSAWAHAWASTV